jgi:hypothetical protein
MWILGANSSYSFASHCTAYCIADNNTSDSNGSTTYSHADSRSYYLYTSHARSNYSCTYVGANLSSPYNTSHLLGSGNTFANHSCTYICADLAYYYSASHEPIV